MQQTITIDPVTRIEGHGKVTLQLDAQGKLAATRFCVKEFRGLEKFCEGTLAELLPSITARICGICPISHHLASTKAVEACFGTPVPPTAKKLRELMLLGQILESHLLSLAMLSLPDLVLGQAKPEQRNLQGLYEVEKETLGQALELRAVGTALARILGRRLGHPIADRVGGVVLPLAEAERKALLDQFKAAEPHLAGFVQRFRTLFEKNSASVESLGKIQTAFLALQQNGSMNFYEGAVRVLAADGSSLESFDAANYFDHVDEQVQDWSYMKFPVLKSGERFRVGPLARVNMVDRLPTPRAAAELEWFRALWPRPAQQSLCYHYARLIETVYAFERGLELLNDPTITQTDVLVKPEIRAGTGVGVVEAPRGTLVHRYELDAEAKAVKVDLLVATQHNNYALNDALHQTAGQLIGDDHPDEHTLNQLEMIVRAYDPCLSCATHTLGARAFRFEVVDPRGHVLQEWF